MNAGYYFKNWVEINFLIIYLVKSQQMGYVVMKIKECLSAKIMQTKTETQIWFYVVYQCTKLTLPTAILYHDTLPIGVNSGTRLKSGILSVTGHVVFNRAEANLFLFSSSFSIPSPWGGFSCLLDNSNFKPSGQRGCFILIINGLGLVQCLPTQSNCPQPLGYQADNFTVSFSFSILLSTCPHFSNIMPNSQIDFFFLPKISISGHNLYVISAF